MANRNPQPKRAKHGEELVQRTRKAVLNAFEALDQRGRKISEILADEAEKNPIKFMELASKLIPKEFTGNVKHDHQHKHTHESVSDTVEWVTGMLGRTENSESKKPSSH